MTELDPELEAVIEALSENYTKDELVAFADEFGVELKPSWNKRAVATAYAEDGITVELIKGLTPDPEEDEDDDEELPQAVAEAPATEATVDVAEADLVLVKMTRPNHSYEVRGYKFTRTHPFGLVTEDDADWLIEHDGGFAMASPKEARAYYS